MRTALLPAHRAFFLLLALRFLLVLPAGFSCNRPFTFASVFTFFPEVLGVTIGFVGSIGLSSPVAGVPIRAGKT